MGGLRIQHYHGCGVGLSCSSLAQEFPYATGVAVKRKKKENKKTSMKEYCTHTLQFLMQLYK